MTETNLFSIDVEAHLRKAASHSFGTSEHYPVEIVRAALRRGAGGIGIQLSRDRLIIQDNGPGLTADEIDTLIAVMDPGQPEALKETAVESLQTRDGQGMLAIFASPSSEINIETVSDTGKLRLHLKQNRFDKSGTESDSLTKGTRITIVGSHRDMEREKQLLEAFCRSVSKEIILNGRSIGKQPLLAGQLATIPLTPSTLVQTGQVGIPQSGRNCHIRLLDQGIPWHHFTLPPREGFIFDAAIEIKGDVTRGMITHLCQHARQLYQWLSNRYPAAEPVHRERIEELLFTYCRLTGDFSLIQEFAPFKILNSKKNLTFKEVKEKSESRTLYAVPQHKETLRYNAGDKTVLSITREQADLLINHAGIPVVFLNPVQQQPKVLHRLRFALKKYTRRIIWVFFCRSKKTLADSQLEKPEQMFLFALTRSLSRPQGTDSFHVPGIRAAFIAHLYGLCLQIVLGQSHRCG